MRSEEIRKILAHGTNMTERDIERHIKDGVSVYDNTEAGYKDYERECIAGLIDPEEIPEMWEKLETVENGAKSYKMILLYRREKAMTKGYVKDFFGNDTKMRSWIFDNGIEVYEKDFDNDLHCFTVYNGEEKLGTIYPDNIDDMESCAESLDAGEDPISGH